MRLLTRVVVASVLGLAPLAVTTTASASEIIDACDYHDIEARVYGVACVGVNYPIA